MLLSIVICNYNHARFLGAAIASAMGQTYANREVIVVDDGSTDESADVIRSWGAQISAIFQRNQGQSAAYNRGFAAARGDVVIFLDSDDLLDPQVGQRVMEAFRDPSVTKVHYRLKLMDSMSRPLGGCIPRRLSHGDLSGMLRSGIFYDSSPASGNAYRRSALALLMPVPAPPGDPHAADLYVIQGCAMLGEVRALGPEPLGSYRIHGERAREQLLFANARQKDPLLALSRYRCLQNWLVERLGPAYRIPDDFVDFSNQKLVFADRIFSSEYREGVTVGSRYLVSQLARGIWRRPTSLAERVGLFGWAIAVLLLPRGIGRPLASYVCNPASRGDGWMSSLVG